MGRATEAFQLLIVKKFPSRREIWAMYPSLSEGDVEEIKIKRRASGRSNKVEGQSDFYVGKTIKIKEQ